MMTGGRQTQRDNMDGVGNRIDASQQGNGDDDVLGDGQNSSNSNEELARKQQGGQRASSINSLGVAIVARTTRLFRPPPTTTTPVAAGETPSSGDSLQASTRSSSNSASTSNDDKRPAILSPSDVAQDNPSWPSVTLATATTALAADRGGGGDLDGSGVAAYEKTGIPAEARSSASPFGWMKPPWRRSSEKYAGLTGSGEDTSSVPSVASVPAPDTLGVNSQTRRGATDDQQTRVGSMLNASASSSSRQSSTLPTATDIDVNNEFKGPQTDGKRLVLSVIQNLRWRLPLGDAEKLGGEPEVEEAPLGRFPPLPSLPPPPAVPEELSSLAISWFSRWGGDGGDGGDTTSQEAKSNSKNDGAESGKAKQSTAAAFTSRPSSDYESARSYPAANATSGSGGVKRDTGTQGEEAAPLSTNYPGSGGERGTPVEALFSAGNGSATVEPGSLRRAFYLAVEEVVGKSLTTVLGRSSRAASGSAATPPSAAEGAASGKPSVSSPTGGRDIDSPPSTTSATSLSLPPAARALRQRSRRFRANNLSFPVRAPWRPLGYRWGASLLSRRSRPSASSPSVLPDEQPIGEAALVEGARDAAAATAALILGEGPVVSANGRGAEDEGGDGLPLLEPASRRMRAVRYRLSRATSAIANRLRLFNEERARLSGSSDLEEEEATRRRSKAIQAGDTAYENRRPVVGKWAGVELVGTDPADDNNADYGSAARGGRGADDDILWWRAGAAVIVGVGAALYRPLASRLLAMAPPALPRTPASPSSEEEDGLTSVDDWVVPPDPFVSTPVRTPTASAVNALEAVTISAGSSRRRDGVARLGSLLEKATTASRRAKLWVLLRRKSMARAQPLLPGVDTGISTLSVPLSAPGMMLPTSPSPSPSPTEERVEDPETPPSSAVELADLVKGVGAAAVMAMASGGNTSEVSVPQAVGGGGWRLFGFFPKDKEELEKREKNSGIAGDSAAAKAKGKGRVAAEKAAATEASSDQPNFEEGDDGEKEEAISWPRSAWVEGLDPRAQVGFGLFSVVCFRVRFCFEHVLNMKRRCV